MADTMIERQHYLITPTDAAQRAIVERIEKASRNELIGTYKIRLNSGYMTTIACVYMEAIVKILVQMLRETKGDASINFLDLFVVASNNRENEDADKDGNININFTPGPTVESIMERDYAPEMSNEEIWKGTIIETIERECGRILQLKHKMTSTKASNWTKIAYVYMVYLFKTIKLMARVASENGKMSVMINFLEIMEFHCNIEHEANPENPDIVREKFTVRIRPGFEAKLLIKDDGVTESDDSDE